MAIDVVNLRNLANKQLFNDLVNLNAYIGYCAGLDDNGILNALNLINIPGVVFPTQVTLGLLQAVIRHNLANDAILINNSLNNPVTGKALLKEDLMLLLGLGNIDAAALALIAAHNNSDQDILKAIMALGPIADNANVINAIMTKDVALKLAGNPGLAQTDLVELMRAVVVACQDLTITNVALGQMLTGIAAIGGSVNIGVAIETIAAHSHLTDAEDAALTAAINARHDSLTRLQLQQIQTNLVNKGICAGTQVAIGMAIANAPIVTGNHAINNLAQVVSAIPLPALQAEMNAATLTEEVLLVTAKALTSAYHSVQHHQAVLNQAEALPPQQKQQFFTNVAKLRKWV